MATDQTRVGCACIVVVVLMQLRPHKSKKIQALEASEAKRRAPTILHDTASSDLVIDVSKLVVPRRVRGSAAAADATCCTERVLLATPTLT
eukprot:358152-Chlamydomonas_euryale.AAC.5